MQTSRSPQEMTRAITTLMEKMNLLYPHSFIMMSSARKYHTMMQLFMRVQVAALFPVRDAPLLTSKLRTYAIGCLSSLGKFTGGKQATRWETAG